MAHCEPGSRNWLRAEDGKVLVSPSGRVLNIRKYRENGKQKAIIYLEIRNNKRRRNLKSFIRTLGPLANGLGDPRRTKRIRNPELVSKVGSMFI